ncbi:hypothetical protein [Mycobacterium intracellulare]|uniref:hypothetical protein n=1 Tax=Mycobacterium intracellulare TaxID=1767 RepID=UPI001E4B43C0|nr:hypothetical protein [Mycobacterium intracellulare]
MSPHTIATLVVLTLLTIGTICILVTCAYKFRRTWTAATQGRYAPALTYLVISTALAAQLSNTAFNPPFPISWNEPIRCTLQTCVGVHYYVLIVITLMLLALAALSAVLVLIFVLLIALARRTHRSMPVTQTGPGEEFSEKTHSHLPAATTADARSAQGATAALAALNGLPVAEAWHQAGVTVPPPGTPVTSPIPPTLLKAGDIGVCKDHLVMALGTSKVLVSGQVQPLTSVDSDPDFLGWMDPSVESGKGGRQSATVG